ncbi:MAG: choice-of-anchor U domain-containing protein [Syntrophaceae bacterium]
MAPRRRHLFAALVALTFIPVLTHAATLTVSVDGSGSIGDGSSTCTEGCTWDYPDGIDVVLSITPDTGYHVADVLVDGTPVGAVPGYTFTGIASDHTISASFAADTYTITSTAGAGGVIEPSGSIAVASGTSQTFAITPDTGYHVEDVLVDGTSVGAVPSHTFTNVTSDHTISASFAVTTASYTLQVNTSGQGVVLRDPEGTEFVSGSQVRLLASAAHGWVFDRWSGDLIGSENPVTLTMDADRTIEAAFLEDDDLDGTSNTDEQGPGGQDKSYDGNHDGIADAAQANVVSRHTYDSRYYLTIASPRGTTLVNVIMEGLPGGEPRNFAFPYGLIGFEVTGITPGSSTTVTIFLPEEETCTTYFKHDEAMSAWDEFYCDYASRTGADISRNVITLNYVDGLRGDQDGIADGTITDPGGPAVKHQSESWNERLCFLSVADTPRGNAACSWIAILLACLLVTGWSLPSRKRRIRL